MSDHDALAAMLDTLRAEFGLADRERKRQEEERVGALADAFLAGLDPGSQVGLWFDAFARSFPSHRAAAIAYVREAS